MTNLSTLQTKLESNLRTVINAPSMASEFKSNRLQNVIEKQFNMLGYLERTNKTQTPQTKVFINKYNTLSGRKFQLDINVNYPDGENLEDEINYFPVYIQNIYKIDMEALAAGKEVKIISPSVEEKASENKFQNPFASMFGGGANPFGNIAPDQNPLLITMAKQRIYKEMSEGRLYAYKTKPRVIPILRLVMCIVLLIGCVSNVILGLGMILSQGFGGSESSNALSTDSAMYFLFAIASLYYSYIAIAPFVAKNITKSNDNRKFYFDTRQLLFLGFWIILIIFFGGLSGDISILTDIHYQSNVGFIDAHKFAIYAWYIGYIMFFIIAGLIVSLGIAFKLLNPKQDANMLDDLTKRYIREMSSSNPTNTTI